MNRELRQLLVEGGYEPAARPDFRWHQVIVHRNIASVPPVRTVPGAALWNHGFNLILLDEHGMATHYAKCRPAAVPEMMHEAAVLTALAGDPVLADIIPRTRTVSSATVRVQVSQFIGDHSWDSDAIIGDVNAWTHAVRGILEVVGRLADRAAVLLPGRVDQRTIRPVDAVGPLLEALVTAGMPNEWIQRLLAAAESAPAVPTSPQHGDLWPANLIARQDGGWWVLDFEMYGRIRVPLHDAFHLVRTSALEDGGGTWLQRLGVGDAWARAQQAIIREAVARGHVPDDAVSALAIYYFAEMTERLHRSGTPRTFWEPYLAELRDAVQRLTTMGTLDDLLLGEQNGSANSAAVQRS